MEEIMLENHLVRGHMRFDDYNEPLLVKGHMRFNDYDNNTDNNDILQKFSHNIIKHNKNCGDNSSIIVDILKNIVSIASNILNDNDKEEPSRDLFFNICCLLINVNGKDIISKFIKYYI